MLVRRLSQIIKIGSLPPASQAAFVVRRFMYLVMTLVLDAADVSMEGGEG